MSSSSSSSSSSTSSSSDSERSSSASSHTRKRQRISEDVGDGHSDSERSDSDNSSDAQSDSGSNAEDDAPALSHAEKRRQKKKAHRSAEGSAETAADGKPSKKKGKEKRKNAAELPPSQPSKRQNSVWVGNLSFKTTPAALRSFFEAVGEITRIHMPTKMATGGPGEKGLWSENRGFAYVDFATPDAKTIAITLSENHLDGRRLLIKDGDDFTGRPAPTAGEDGAGTAAAPKATGHTKAAQKILRMQKQPPGPTIFLGNLGFETTQDTIRELFESHRTKEPTDGADADKWIRKIRLGTFEDSGKCKGWAFVDFTSTEHATAALTHPRNHQMNGRKLVVEYASPEAVRRGGGGPPRTTTDKHPQAGGGGGGGGRGNSKDKGGERSGAKRDRPARGDQRQTIGDAAAGEGREGEEGGGGGGGGGEEHGRPAKRRRSEAGDDAYDRGWKGRPRPRTKPGAALALAKREDVSIVPSQGKKIVF